MTRVESKIPQLARCVLSAFSVPYPEKLQPIVRIRPEHKQYEPDPDDVFNTLLVTLNGTEIDPKIDFSDVVLRRRDIAVIVINFSDLSRIKPCEEMCESAHRAARLILKMENVNRETGHQISLSEQLKHSLDGSKGNVPRALLDLTLATRQAARNCDNRIFETARVKPGDYHFTEQRMMEWKKIPKALCFPDGDKPSDDPMGDTYHFWATAAAGYARESCASENRINPVNRLKTTVSDWMYSQQAGLTGFRYRLIKDEGFTHESADIVGYEIGRGIYTYLAEQRGSS